MINEVVITSTHNLYFRDKIRKIMHTPVNSIFYCDNLAFEREFTGSIPVQTFFVNI